MKIFGKILIFCILLKQAEAKKACPSGSFQQDHFAKTICRTCGAVYKNCNTCDPKNLDSSQSFCTQCKWFYKGMSFSTERTAVIDSMRNNKGYIDPDKFGWECEFQLLLLIAIISAIIITTVASIVYYCYERRKRINEEIRVRRDKQKEKEYGRLVNGA